MIPAALPSSGAADAKLLVVDAAGQLTPSRASRVPDLVCARATSSSRTMRRRCRRASSGSAPADGARPWSCGWPDGIRSCPRRQPLHGDCVRRRRLSHADGAASATARPAAGGHAAARPTAGGRRRGARTSAADRRAFRDSVAAIWEGVARHGRPIQYAYSRGTTGDLGYLDADRGPAGRVRAAVGWLLLDWSAIRSLRSRGARFATLTHAAGISSTGDAELDRRLRSTSRITSRHQRPR